MLTYWFVPLRDIEYPLELRPLPFFTPPDIEIFDEWYIDAEPDSFEPFTGVTA